MLAACLQFFVSWSIQIFYDYFGLNNFPPKILQVILGALHSNFLQTTLEILVGKILVVRGRLFPNFGKSWMVDWNVHVLYKGQKTFKT